MVRTYEQIKREILNDLKEPDTMHYREAGYDNWYSFFGDGEYGCDDIELYEEVMRVEFTEDAMEQIWQKSHKRRYYL